MADDIENSLSTLRVENLMRQNQERTKIRKMKKKEFKFEHVSEGNYQFRKKDYVWSTIESLYVNKMLLDLEKPNKAELSIEW